MDGEESIMSDKPNRPVPLEDRLCYSVYSAGLVIQRA
ncbi:hypothetical protein N825_22460 [Skermanella stibiiresistens SB22]|uniref:Uncharacterized protein n=1 Tax=Skermanella stibiiresistens SB22 TaxID=1385369 RepID=W9GRV5_9PROT|nr:hypothetical protein N825_22460 [Skermanella stibiiresistens SB22]